MKKALIALFLLCLAEPVFADVINPNVDLVPNAEQRQKIYQGKRQRYIQNTRLSTLNRVCGAANVKFRKANYSEVFNKTEIEKCKVELKRDYEENIKFLDKYAKESKQNADKNIKSANKQ